MKPFTQGSLEYTCGLYAIVNSIRMATLNHKRLSNSHWFELYFALTKAADEKLGGTGTIIREGLTSTELKVLLRAANRWMLTAVDVRIAWKKPYRLGRTPSKVEYLETLRQHLSAGGTAIVSIGGDEEHWTCLYDMTVHSFIFCDSDGMTSMRISRLPNNKLRKAMPIDPTYTFLINRSP